MSFLDKIAGKKTNGSDSRGEDGIEHVEAAGDSVVSGANLPTESIVTSADLSVESIVISQAYDSATYGSFEEPKKGFFDRFKGNKSNKGSDFSDLAEVGDVTELQTPSADPVNDAGFEDIILPRHAAESQSVDAHSLSSTREEEIIREIGERPIALPIIGKMPAKTQYAVSFGLLLASIAIAGGMAATGFLKSAEYQGRAEVGTRVQMLTQRMLATTQYAIAGSKESGDRLKESRADVDTQMAALIQGNGSLNAMNVSSNEALNSTNDVLKKEILPRIDQVIELSPSLESLSTNSLLLNKAIYSIYVSADQLLSLLQFNGSPQIQVTASNHIRLLSERMRRNGANLLTSNEVTIEALPEYTTDFRLLRSSIQALIKGDEVLGMPPVADAQALAILNDFKKPIGDVTKVTDYLEKNGSALVTARRNLQALTVKSEAALKSSSAFSQEMRESSESALGTVYLSAIFVIAALASLALIGLVNNRSTRLEAWESAFKNMRNEKDIIEFMEACLPLEMGDLTVRFNQMEAMDGITGGIRNSVNEAVISLNEAVDTVKQTAEDVSGVVSDSVRNTSEMKRSNERQAQEITDVETRVAELTRAIGEVTERTLEAARATDSARSASAEGARVVSQTNEKMGMIRANMQDVLKSVKNLGETSHEIGDIVGTIEQITDRTQVLAVNASLEAAKAGAAGAGFQIIAGEVNRLAEQSADALRTITALVQRVQGETAVTIRVVEESTNNVVDGARLSEVANTQLEQISTLATGLSSIMTEIRSQAANQTTNADEVRISIERLAVLSREFQSQVAQVVSGVQQIDASMGSLKNTVAIFTTEGQVAA